MMNSSKCTCGVKIFTRNASYKPAYDSATGKLKYRLPPKIRMQPALPAAFRTNVTHSDGSTITVHTTSPRPSMPLSRDVYNSPLWSFSQGGVRGREEDESGRMSRFEKKFSASVNEAQGDGSMGDLLMVDGENVAIDPKMIARSDRGNKGKKKGKK